jgi:hypothetical protein
MRTYDPAEAPPAAAWLRLDEAECLALVTTYHRRKKIRLPNVRLHAIIHVVVENQLALGEQVVVDTLARLRKEGLDRHDAIHAIGSVLAEHLYALLREHDERTTPSHDRYFEQLKKLTAAAWRAR